MATAVKHKGSLTRAADKAGETTHEFAESHKDSSGVTGKRARLALTFAKYRPK